MIYSQKSKILDLKFFEIFLVDLILEIEGDG